VHFLVHPRNVWLIRNYHVRGNLAAHRAYSSSRAAFEYRRALHLSGVDRSKGWHPVSQLDHGIRVKLYRICNGR